MIPVLPDAIAEKFNDASPAEDSASDAEVDAFLAAHTTGARPEVLNGFKKALTDKFAAKLSRHGSTMRVLVGAMKEARAGYYPAMTAYDTIRPMFLEAVAKPPASSHQDAARNGEVAGSEFDGILAWAVGQANAADLDEVRARVEEKMPGNLFDDDPIPLTQTVPIPAFPVDSLPEPIADMVCAVAEATQTDPAMAGTSALSAVSACTGGHAEIEIRRGWREPLCLYLRRSTRPVNANRRCRCRWSSRSTTWSAN